MKKIILLVALTFSYTIGFAQNLDLNGQLPIDSTIIKGVLPNGMTYYLKSTKVVPNAASYYIIQNVGSILENEEQRGLAHFLEHMAFNGTQHFEGKGILNTLQRHGAVFGKDINAYTSFDETVYNLNNIPTKDGLLDTCLLVLKDWSNYLLLTDEEIDAERGVIKEEWRTRQNGRMRIFEKTASTIFNNSKYAERFPIGLMSVVEGFEYKALRDFYHDWYRTDLQAIAVIGDFDVKKVEAKIKKSFSEIPAVKNPKERFIVDIPGNKEPAYVMATDPEISTAHINFGMRHHISLHPQKVKDLKKVLLESMTCSMINSRLSEKAQDPNSPFLGASVSYSEMGRTTKAFDISVSPKEKKQQEAFTDVMNEVARALKFGFAKAEIDRIIKSFTSFYENQINTLDNRQHGSYIREIQANFLEQSTITDTKGEFEIAKKIFADLTPKDFLETLKRLYTKNNRYITVTGVEGQNNLTEKQALDIIKNSETNTSLSAYNDEFAGKTLLDDRKITPGTIVKTQINDKLNCTTFTLSNGIVVHYKFVNKQKDEISLYGISYGGNSLLSDKDLASASFATSLAGMSGLGDYNLIELKKVLTGKNASISFSINDLSETISGGSNQKDIETMFRKLYLSFTAPRFDKQAYEVLITRLNNYLISKKNNVRSQKQDSLTITLYGKNNPRKQLFDKDFISKVNFDKSKNIYMQRFANPADFEFFIVGDVSSETLKPLLTKYMASLPTTKVKEKFKDVEPDWISDNIDKDIIIKMKDPKSTVNITRKINLKYSPKNILISDALGDILQLRLTETLREEEGGVYSPSAYTYLEKLPQNIAFLGVNFDCNPDLTEKLISIVYKEIKDISEGKIKDEDFNKTLTNFKKEREQYKSKNSYYMNELTTYYRNNYYIDDAKNFSNIIDKMTKKDIAKLAKNFLDKSKSFEIVFKPLEEDKK